MFRIAVQYGMGSVSLSKRINQPLVAAKELLKLHQDTYKTFWEWSDATVDFAMLNGKLWTSFGWTIHNSENPNPRFLRNFLMQGNGAEMLRHACCLATERGIRVCAPVHDAILIEAPLCDLHKDIATAKEAMAQSSELILNGLKLRIDADIIKYPDRYCDERGQSMWDLVQSIIA
jgi:DNA polymerase-1